MSGKTPLTFRQKEAQLLEKIEKAKKSLANLKHKRVADCGELMVKHGLDQFELPVLDQAFAQLAQKLRHENA